MNAGKCYRLSCSKQNEINELEAKLKEASEELEKAKAVNAKFKPWGTDQCSECETGRVTLFRANDKCMECAPETYTKEWARSEDKDKLIEEMGKNLAKCINAMSTVKSCYFYSEYLKLDEVRKEALALYEKSKEGK